MRKGTLSIGLCAVVVAALVNSVFATAFVPTPSVDVQVNGVSQDTTGFSLTNPSPGIMQIQGELQTSDYKINLSASAKEDPYIIYGISAQNFTGGVMTFTFVLSTPIVATTYDNAFASVSVSMTDDITGNGVTVTPVAAKLQVTDASAPVTNLGVDVGAGGTGGPGSPLWSYTLPADNKSNTFAPTVFTTLTTSLAFTLTGGGDVATINGAAQITPEPTALVLAGLGMLMCGLRRRSVS